MKKILKNLAVVSCVIPTILLATGCNKNNKNDKEDAKQTTLTVEQKNQAFGYLKTLSTSSSAKTDKEVRAVEEMTTEMAVDVSAMDDAVLATMGFENDPAETTDGKTAKQKFKSYLENDMHMGGGYSSKSQTVMGYKSNGEGYKVVSDYDDEEEVYALSNAEYIKKSGDDYILYQIYKTETDENKSASKVGNDYSSHMVNYALDESAGMDEESVLAKCSNFEDFKTQIKTYFVESMQSSQQMDLSTANLTVTMDLQFKDDKYELVAAITGQDLSIASPMGDVDVDLSASTKISFTQSAVLSEVMEVNVDSSMSMDLSAMGGSGLAAEEQGEASGTQAPSMVIGIDSNMTMKSEQYYDGNFDATKLDQDFTSYADGEITNRFVGICFHYTVEGEDGNYQSSSIEFGSTIDWTNVIAQADAALSSVLTGCTFEYYLDKAMSVVANSTNLEKAPSYTIDVYVKVIAPAQA